LAAVHFLLFGQGTFTPRRGSHTTKKAQTALKRKTCKCRVPGKEGQITQQVTPRGCNASRQGV
jgi:hypothetical protein